MESPIWPAGRSHANTKHTPSASAAITTPADGLTEGMLTFPASAGFAMNAYRAKPANRKNATVILVVQEIFGVHEWIKDINETQGCAVNFPIIADHDRKVSQLYDMIHPNADSSLTVRSLFVIDPNKKVRLMITYPASTGRNFNEVLRVIDSLQLTDEHKVATPGNWERGGDVVIVPSLQDEEEIKQRFPKGYKAVKSYLRMTPDPKANWSGD